MKKPLLVILIIVLILLISLIGLKLNSSNYKKLANDRIEKVIALQGANLENAIIHEDRYDYFDSSYSMKMFFNDDKKIEYRYNYERSRDRVHVTAYSGNASLDLLNIVGKYDYFIKVYFDSNGEITKIEK